MEQVLRDAAARDAPDAVVVVGGDGTLHSAVNALARTSVAVGIVAAGTGNDVARCLGLPHDDPDAAIAHLVGGARAERRDGRARSTRSGSARAAGSSACSPPGSTPRSTSGRTA